MKEVTLNSKNQVNNEVANNQVVNNELVSLSDTNKKNRKAANKGTAKPTANKGTAKVVSSPAELTIKGLSTIQKTIINKNKESLSYAAKLYCDIFSTKKAAIEALKEKKIQYNETELNAIVSLAKDKEMVMRAVIAVAPQIDGVIVRAITIETEYVNGSEKNSYKSSKWLDENLFVGYKFKKFGFANPVSIDGEKPTVKVELFKNETKTWKIGYVKHTKYTVEYVAKMITYYLKNKPVDMA